MKRHISLLPISLTVISLFAATGADAAAIDFHAVTPSTSIPSCEVGTCGKPVWPIAEISDGIIVDGAPFNGFAGLTGALGTISLDLNGTFDISGFSLWNDINIVNEGVRSFRLDFYNAANASVGSSAVLSAVSKFASNDYTFASPFTRVSRVDMVILGISGRVEIREVGFNGAPSAPVPEPGAPVLFGIGLTTVAMLARQRRKKAR